MRQLRLHWPRVEKLLRAGKSPIVITRDGVPVATLMPYAPKDERPRFDPVAHLRMLRSRPRLLRSLSQVIADSRAEE